MSDFEIKDGMRVRWEDGDIAIVRETTNPFYPRYRTFEFQWRDGSPGSGDIDTVRWWVREGRMKILTDPIDILIEAVE